MNYKFQKLFAVLFATWVGLVACTGAFAQAKDSKPDDIEIQKIKAPPRDVKDILRVLEQSPIDLSEIERAKAVVAQPEPPAGSSAEVLNAYHFKRSVAFQKLGKLDEAVVSARLTALDFKHPNPQFELRDIVNMGVIENFLGNQPQAIKAYLTAKAGAEKNKMGGMILGTNRLLVGAYSSTGNFEAAKASMLDADAQMTLMRRSPRLGEFVNLWESQVESARGIYLSSQGLWVESERAYRKALHFLNIAFKNAQDNAKRVDELADGPRVLTDGSNTTRGYITQISSRSLNLAVVLLQQRKLVDAEFYAREALKLSLDNFGRNSSDVGRALATLSRIISEQGRFDEALLLAKASMTAHTESGITDESSTMAMARKFYATALVAKGQYKEADQAFTQMMASVQKDPELAKTFNRNDLDWVMAMQKIGKTQEAMAMSELMYQRVLKQAGKTSPRTALVGAFHAGSLQGMGKANEAYAVYKEVTPILVDEARNDAENNTASIKQQQRTTFLFENYLSLLAQLSQSTPSNTQALAAEAFRVADMAKSSGVQRALTASAARANISDPQLALLARKEQDLQRRVNTLSELLTGLVAAPPEQQLPSVQAKIRQDIEAFKAERDKLKKDIAYKVPDYAEMVEPKPATIERTRALLKPNEVLVSWYFADKEAYVWAISKQDVPLFKSIPMGRADMAQRVAHLRKSLDPAVATIDEIPPFDTKASFALYQQLLEPVAASLKGKQVMLVVPHAELGQLPLSVLVTQETAPASPVLPAASKGNVLFSHYKQVPWLARDIAIAQLPSVTALTALRNTPVGNPNRKNFIGFGDPFFSTEQAKDAEKVATATQLGTRGAPLKLRNTPKTSGVSSAELALLPRLPDTQEEILEIAKVFGAAPEDVLLNRQASVQNILKADLSNRKVVMFSTHGLVPGELDGLTQPALAMTSPDVTGDKDDGLLTMDMVLGLRLNADWVVLSACNTASGEGSGSEAVSGLGRAFFFAGAKALLVSNWPVDSVAARLLMTDLFKRQQGAAGFTPVANKPDALRQAMLHLMAEGGMEEGGVMKYSYAHPLFWAPFVVVGD